MAFHVFVAPMSRPILIACVLFASAAMAIPSVWSAEPKVEAKDGNIFLRADEGEAKQLTTSGRDSAPVLSPDRRWVVFIRGVPGRKISTGAGDVDAEELWQVRADSEDPTRLVAPKAADDAQNVVANFQHVQFSSDGRLVYFVTEAYATSGAVHVVDTTKGKERFFVAGSTVEVVRRGEYRDCLLVSQHRYLIGGGSYDWIWLFRPDGKEVGPVGEDAESFKDTYYPEEEKGRGKP